MLPRQLRHGRQKDKLDRGSHYDLVLLHDRAFCLIFRSEACLIDDCAFPQAICAWFYAGQPELGFMLNCPGSVAQALASGAADS